MNRHARTRIPGRHAVALIAVLAAVALAVGSNPAQAQTKDADQQTKGYLGVQLQNLDKSLLEALDLTDVDSGVLVSEVVDDSPADEAGLRRGDVITSFDGKPVRKARDLTRLVADTEPGTEVAVEVARKGETKSLEVEIGRQESPRVFTWRGDRSSLPPLMLQAGGPRLGVRVEEMNAKLGHYFGTDEGLLVLEVYDDTPAKDAGIEVGDVLQDVDGAAIDDVASLRDALEEHDEGDTVTVGLLRDQHKESVQVEVREPEDLDMADLFEGGMPPGHRWRMREAPYFRFYGPGSRHFDRDEGPRGRRYEAPDDDWGDDQQEWSDEMDDLRRELRDLRKELDALKEKQR
jgi:predicted metalloprotease with PDZ domain